MKLIETFKKYGQMYELDSFLNDFSDNLTVLGDSSMCIYCVDLKKNVFWRYL